MNFFERCLYFLQGTMERPTPFGWFHWLCIGIMSIAILLLYLFRKKYNEKQLKWVLFIYGFTAFTLELIKQLIWSFNYDSSTNIVTWDYQWYSFPFQLCTTPIFVSLICAFLKPGKVRTSLFSYLSFVTILGSISTILLPDSCFVETIEVNIHTMWLHLGSFVVSIYLMMVGEVKITRKNLKNALLVFVIFVIIAQIFNISVYHSGILNDETYNMFYISPYFISTLPVFDIIQQNVPYILYLLIYIIVIGIGTSVIFEVANFIKKINRKKGKSK